MNNTIKRTWNQGSMVNIEDLRGMTFQAESGGHTFVISGVDADGNAVALSGTPAGTMLRPDDTDQALTCSVSGGKVYATLPAGCYDVPGRAGITIFLTSDSQKTAIYAAIVSVTRTQSGTVAPGTTASVVDLINAINAAISQIPASDANLKAAMAPTYSGTALYSVGQCAWDGGVLYECTVPITEAENPRVAAHWKTADLSESIRSLRSAMNDIRNDIALEYDNTATYTQGQYCTYNGNFYKARQDIDTAEEWDLSHWQYVKLANDIDSRINSQKAAIEGQLIDLRRDIAPIYSAEDTYTKGQYVAYDGSYYRAMQDISIPEAWDSSHWQWVRIANDLENRIEAEKTARENADGTIENAISDLPTIRQNITNNTNKIETDEILNDDRFSIIETPYGKNHFNQRLITGNGITFANGVFTATAAKLIELFGDENYIPVICEAGKPYTLSFKAYTDGAAGTTGSFTISLMRTNGSTVSHTDVSVPNNTSTYTEFTLSSTNASYKVIGVSFHSASNSGNTWNLKEFMLTEGSSAENYIPYFTAYDKTARENAEYAYRSDLRWVYGSIASATGKDQSSNTASYIKSAEYLRGVTDIRTDYKLRVFYYTSAFVFIDKTQYDSNGAHWTSDLMPNNAEYVRILVIGTNLNISNINSFCHVLQKRDEVYGEIDAVKSFAPCGEIGTYTGEVISVSRRVGKELLMNGPAGSGCQDGCCIGDLLFQFTSSGTFDVYNMKTTLAVETNCQMGLPTENVAPHCNSVCIGIEKNASNIPYVYVNAYNAEGLPMGACYVYSITNSSGYTAELIQTILIGFTSSETWTDGTSTRPYGNFIVDIENGFLYVITQPTSNKERVFKFELPQVASGTVTLAETDIVDQFDLPWLPYIQGSAINNGRLYQLSGFGSTQQSGTYPGFCHVIDLEREKEVSTIPLDNIGVTSEPELIDVYDNKLILASGGFLYGLSF